MNRVKKLPLCLLFLVSSFLFPQSTYEEFLKQQQQAQQDFFEDEEKEFKNYVAAVTAEYDQYDDPEHDNYDDHVSRRTSGRSSWRSRNDSFRTSGRSSGRFSWRSRNDSMLSVT